MDSTRSSTHLELLKYILRLLDRSAGPLHCRRTAGLLPSAGREDLRQAHRSDCLSDAAPRADRGSQRHRLHRRRAGRAFGAAGRERPYGCGRQTAGDLRKRAAGYHQGIAVDRFVHLGRIVPGNHPRADRSGDHGQARRSARPEGKRHRRPPDLAVPVWHSTAPAKRRKCGKRKSVRRCCSRRRPIWLPNCRRWKIRRRRRPRSITATRSNRFDCCVS